MVRNKSAKNQDNAILNLISKLLGGGGRRESLGRRVHLMNLFIGMDRPTWAYLLLLFTF